MSPSSVIVLMTNGAIGVRANTVGVMAAEPSVAVGEEVVVVLTVGDDHQVEIAPRVGGARTRSTHRPAPPSPAGHRPAPQRRGRTTRGTAVRPLRSPRHRSVAVAGELVATVAGALVLGAGEDVGDLVGELVEVERADQEGVGA